MFRKNTSTTLPAFKHINYKIMRPIAMEAPSEYKIPNYKSFIALVKEEKSKVATRAASDTVIV